MTPPVKAVLAVAFVLVVLGLIARPRILLAPVVAFFAAWTWFKTILLLPVNVHEWLVASTLEKHASALASHASCAQALWSANSELRPAAKEIYGRVIAGYGIFPQGARDENDDGPAAPGEDPFHAASRNAAAEGITKSRGGLKAAPPAAGPKA